jgi:pimeloyl-ACP methyl ester carboxylesterase
MSAMVLPMALTKLSYLIDNPWVVSQARADMAGRILGTRPITLVGFSLGARVIFSCLKELAVRGAFGLVQNVYMFGTPVVAKKDDYIRARAIVPGRFVNGYATNDWILGEYSTTQDQFLCLYR